MVGTHFSLEDVTFLRFRFGDKIMHRRGNRDKGKRGVLVGYFVYSLAWALLLSTRAINSIIALGYPAISG